MDVFSSKPGSPPRVHRARRDIARLYDGKVNTERFDIYATIIRGLNTAALEAQDPPPELLIAADGDVSIFYAPFDAVNQGAEIILAGITPGRTQMNESLRAASRLLASGVPNAIVLNGAKEEASYAGPMRKPLVRMLDHFQIHNILGIPTSAELFGTSRHLVHYTSALRYPVFVKGKYYKGSPAMTRHPLLRRYLLEHFAAELQELPRALVIPLGDKLSESIEFIAEHRQIGRERILSGLEHPSGANSERVAYLIGRKERGKLSAQVRPERIDRARSALEAKVAALLNRSS